MRYAAILGWILIADIGIAWACLNPTWGPVVIPAFAMQIGAVILFAEDDSKKVNR